MAQQTLGRISVLRHRPQEFTHNAEMKMSSGSGKCQHCTLMQGRFRIKGGRRNASSVLTHAPARQNWQNEIGKHGVKWRRSIERITCSAPKLSLFQIVAVAALLAVAYAAPQSPDAAATILRYDSDNIGVDGYSYA